MISIFDYGAGNLRSVENTLGVTGADYELVRDAEGLRRATKIILPGVGHFGQMMRALDEMDVRAALIETIRAGVPFLGICLGLQALYESSEEAPTLRGLGLLPGRVTRLPDEVKLPHMGWNTLKSVRASRLLESVSSDAHFYFAHSFAAPVAGDETVAVSAHGREFAAVLEKGNIRAVQFHPEKSGEAGAQVLRNFLRAAA